MSHSSEGNEGAAVTVTTVGSGRLRTDLRVGVQPALRTLATVTLIGVWCGVLVVGVISRLAMLLLAELNPEVRGVTSDDGFVMGQFTLSGSVNLALLAGPLLGILGAGCYVALRGLTTGPPWFRLLSISLGPGVVVGSVIVHTDGVDFTLLEPLWLTVALFVLIPAVYVVLLSLIAERVLAADRQWPRLTTYLGIACWGPLFPVFLLLAAGWAALVGLRHSGIGATLLAHPATAWTARGVLVAVFLYAVVDLASDVRALT
jgi:hypothetical protein